MTSALFSSHTQRGVTLRNRIAVSPMSQYSAVDGMANDWHLVTLGKLAQGGAGLVMIETAAVTPEGRGTHGDLGLWSDAQIAPLARIVEFIAAQGAVPALQIGHAGRKASLQRPWEGYGRLGAQEAARGEFPWPTIAPSALPISPGDAVPAALDEASIGQLLQQFEVAAARAAQAGVQVLEVHAAHGYLLHQFLSPLSNLRDDAWGGDALRRMAFPLAVLRRVRAAWPQERPLWLRVSAVDGADGGRTLDDTLALARAAKAEGVDLIDCSSGGIAGLATAGNRIPRGLGFQVPFAQAVRAQAGIASMAVGLILTPQQAEDIVRSGQADVVALGRELLNNPNWPWHARQALVQPGFAQWPPQYGWWLDKRAAILQQFDVAAGSSR